MTLEIERKFQVVDNWDLPPGCTTVHVRQAYLTPQEAHTEVRVRALANTYVMTVKATRDAGTSGANVREEVEFPIDEQVFHQLWELAPDRLTKERSTVPLDGPEAVVDVYTGAHAGLRVVEVEFADADQARSFEPPCWFGLEITGQAAWGNRSLAGGSEGPTA
ncbi:adenylate cyclase [Streptomyces sp. MI02-7b]|uniref:CYTH domain-containing protein n=1 Tax=Streptomyces sp. MI02-7b TaxID=462941 RepID=UPI0029BB888B|nr:adenylate cyclase [Streptomyces sp. MI02-7b]MDX3075928.1 adenylate cyclase [Streptomyces sp. MI02-7b]